MIGIPSDASWVEFDSFDWMEMSCCKTMKKSLPVFCARLQIHPLCCTIPRKRQSHRDSKMLQRCSLRMNATPHCLLFSKNKRQCGVAFIRSEQCCSILLVSTITTQWKLKPTNQNKVLWWYHEWCSKRHVNTATSLTIILNSPILSDSDGESSFLDHTFN